VTTITIDRAVMQKALEWADNHGEIVFAGGGWKAVEGMNAWAHALRAALAQQEQEPEPPTQAGALHAMKTALWKPQYMDAMSAEKGAKATPLYTAPPRREWRSLSEEEINETLDNNLEGGTSLFDICRAVEAALKEKNHE